jgi:hypothetical protein
MKKESQRLKRSRRPVILAETAQLPLPDQGFLSLRSAEVWTAVVHDGVNISRL